MFPQPECEGAVSCDPLVLRQSSRKRFEGFTAEWRGRGSAAQDLRLRGPKVLAPGELLSHAELQLWGAPDVLLNANPN